MKYIILLLNLYIYLILTNIPIRSEDFNTALEFNKKADQYLSDKNFSQAIKELERAEKFSTMDGYYATKIGFIYSWNLNNNEAAIQNLERALKQGGEKKSWTLREYGYVLMKMEMYDTAEEFLKMAIDTSIPKTSDLLDT